EDIDKTSALHYLTSYFSVSNNLKEQIYFKLPAKEKNILLESFYRGGEELIWKINNLHAITDTFGYEISQHQLHNYSIETLKARFKLLSPYTRFQFKEKIDSATTKKDKKQLIAILTKATSIERKATAENLSSASIYILMTRGSELYDSSFRNILTPIIQKRIKLYFNDNLLSFLAHIDPDSHYISDFIISLAQKGKLTSLLPKSSIIQQQILALTIDSAFNSEDSIILFSATLMRLLEVLHPDSRTFLINRIIAKAAQKETTHLKLIIALLQYYHNEYGELIGAKNDQNIINFLTKHGTINLKRYQTTPFSQWKSDNKLASLSVFHPDDDGRSSFQTNATTLLAGGYKPELSINFTLLTHTSKELNRIKSIIKKSQTGSTKNLSTLFNAMRNLNFAIDFSKMINKVIIKHSVFIYQDPKQQQLLLSRFLNSDTEMFAQRGHSYWRSEQLIDPFKNLLKSNNISKNLLLKRHRFLSLGSCGGVKAYSKLNRLFLCNIDILATIGTGLATINNPYNKNLFEIIAENPSSITWKEVADLSSSIFSKGRGRDYLQPGSLPAVLQRLLMEENKYITTQ
ncbi:MAG: hypothetical protein OEM02_09010, partial [Desulfobulbaceae bacterium]|nr:hypothetical protein [Desulfobulbaceae bacterium]